VQGPEIGGVIQDGGASAIASCDASRNFVKTRRPMESFISVTFSTRRERRLSILISLDWGEVDWFLVSLLMFAVTFIAAVLSTYV
jgi:hypothetical protein